MFDFEHLVEEFSGTINYLVNKHNVYHYDKDDLRQELLIVLWNTSLKFDPQRGVKFSTYFVNSCLNRIMYLRRKNKEKDMSLNVSITDDTEFADLVEDNLPLVEEQLLWEEKKDIVDKVFDTHPFGEIARLHIAFGVPQNTLSTLYGYSKGWVNKKIKEVTELIKEKLEELK